MAIATSAGRAEVMTRALGRLGSAPDLPTVSAVLHESARLLVGADGASVVLHEGDHCSYVDDDVLAPVFKGVKLAGRSCLAGWVMRADEPTVVPDIDHDDRVSAQIYRPGAVRSLALVPVRTERGIEVLEVWWSTLHEADDLEIRRLEMLASGAAAALDKLALRAELDRSRDDRDAAVERRDELELAIHAIAHDLRAPLGTIIGYADLLDRYLASGQSIEAARMCADTVAQAGVRMTEQIDQMLALYKITNRPLTPEPVDLTRMSRRIVDGLLVRDASRSIHVDVQDDMHAVADPALAQLLLQNLLDNAFKYTSETRSPRVEVGVDGRDDRFVTFYVRDNGAGFDPEQADRLFVPMARLEGADRFPGNGLGLASVARIVQRHGGSVRAEGRPAEGAAFYFSLPLAA